MTEEYNYPSETPKNNNNTVLIVGIIIAVVVVCCCCCSLALAWQYGDTILEEFDMVLQALPLQTL